MQFEAKVATNRNTLRYAQPGGKEVKVPTSTHSNVSDDTQQRGKTFLL